jgi:hypothetical protein
MEAPHPAGPLTRGAAGRRFPQVADLGKILRAVDGYFDTDFDLLCSSAEWFMHNTASGLTPRQIPIEGLHAKWLDSHQALLPTLTGTDDLGLLPRHPQRLHFTYLDPEYRAAGGRTHDSATVGDPMAPAYCPEIVIISENKDTAMHFPPLRKAISVEGAGFGGVLNAQNTSPVGVGQLLVQGWFWPR